MSLILTPSQLRTTSTIQVSLSFALPFISLVAALIAVIFFYSVNASDSVDTFLSWTCRWRAIPMWTQPNWGTLCKQSKGGIYLSILLVPVEAGALALSGWLLKERNYVERYVNARKSPSPS